MFLLPSVQPPWGTADAVKVPSVENRELTNVLPLKFGVGRNTAMHASPTAGNFFLVPNSTFPVHSLFLFFFLLFLSFFFFFLFFFFFFFKVPSVENPELTNVLPLRPGWSRSDYSHACFTPHCQECLPCPNFDLRGPFAFGFCCFSSFFFYFCFLLFFSLFFSSFFLLQIRLPVFELC